MKALRITFAFISVILFLFFLFPLFIAPVYKVERSIEINAPDSIVYNKVANFNHMIRWYPWSKKEPDAINTISGEPGKPGSTWAWHGNEIGKGKLTIEKTDPGKYLECKLTFIEPLEDTGQDFWHFEKTEKGTKTTWIMQGEASYPFGRYISLTMDDLIGKRFEEGLADLKTICEENNQQ